MEQKCTRCNGTGWANAARDSGMEDMPLMLRPIGVYQCPSCNGRKVIGFTEKELEELKESIKKKTKGLI